MTLIAAALGIDEARAYLKPALGERPDVIRRRDGAAAIRFITSPEAGTLRWLRAVAEMTAEISIGIGPAPARRDLLNKWIRLLVAATINVIEAVVAITVGTTASPRPDRLRSGLGHRGLLRRMAWYVYVDAYNRGAQYCVRPGYSVSKLNDWFDLDDKISAVQILGSSSCGTATPIGSYKGS
ncbi:hypothetical protein [Streptomyces chryseus]